MEHVIDGAAAEKVVGEWRLVGAGVKRDSLGGRLQVALERDAGARLGRVVVEAHVAAERLPQVDVPEISKSPVFSFLSNMAKCIPETLRQDESLADAEFLHPLQGVGVAP